MQGLGFNKIQSKLRLEKLQASTKYVPETLKFERLYASLYVRRSTLISTFEGLIALHDHRSRQENPVTESLLRFNFFG